MELAFPQKHEDPIPRKKINPLIHYILVRKLITVPQAIKIPDAKAATDNEWEKLKTIPAGGYWTFVISIMRGSTPKFRSMKIESYCEVTV